MRTTTIRPLSPSAPRSTDSDESHDSVPGCRSGSAAVPRRRRAHHFFAALSCAALVGLPCVDAAAAVLEATPTKVTSATRTELDQMGKSVSLQGDLAAVGVPGDGQIGVGAGAVLIFHRSGTTWTQEAKLTGAATTDAFGTSVSLSGTTLVVGAPNANNGKGAAYVFQRVTSPSVSWGTTASAATLHTLATPALVDQDQFGQSVALSGTTAIVGAPGSASTTGFAFVFRLNGVTWALDGTRLAGSVTQGRFGQAVAVDADFAIVGSKQSPTIQGGAAFVFQRVTSPSVSWGTGTQLFAPITAFDRFGDSVAISGSWALVGAPEADQTPDDDVGGVFFFHRTTATWAPCSAAAGGCVQSRRDSPNPTLSGEYGRGVSLSGSRALVGAPSENAGNGRLYVLALNGTTWSLAQPALSSISTEGYFGASASLSSNGEAIAGASLEACPSGDQCGAAYLFTNALAPAPLLGVPGALALMALLGACGGLVLRRRSSLARG